MDDKRLIEGKWWIGGKNAPAFFGTLTYDPSRELRLVVKNPSNRSLAEILSDSVTVDNLIFSPVLHGEDEHGKAISLFGCGTDSHSISGGMETFNINAIAGLLGEDSPSWQSAKFIAAEIHFTLLHEWIGESPIEHAKTADGRPAMALKPSGDARLYDLPDGDKLRFVSDVSGEQSLRSYKWKFDHRAWLHFASEKSLANIAETDIPTIRQLLSLLIGAPVYVEKVRLFHSDPFTPAGEPTKDIELLRPNRGLRRAPRDLHAMNMVASFSEIEGTFQKVLTRWCTIYRDLEPVIDLYFGVLFNKQLPLKTQFLQLAQALEAYHSRSGRFQSTELPTSEHRRRVGEAVRAIPLEFREWAEAALEHANKKTLADRLKDIFALYESEAKQLFSGVTDVATRIRHTRNYLTHYDDKTRTKIFTDRELSRVTFAMFPFLQICLLKELDIAGAPTSRILHRHSKVTFVDLDSVEQKKAAS